MSTISKARTEIAHDPIPLCVPAISGNEWKYVKECLDTGWVSSVGSFVDRFERELASYVGTKYAVATVNGTAALHIALLVAGVQPDDEVLVSDLTFIAPVNAIRYVGAWPVLIDAEPEYWQINTEQVIDFLENKCYWKNGELRNKISGRKVKAILPVHILGHPVDMDPILEIAHKYELVVIEDATESLGAKYKDQMVGHLGDIACFSFNGNKLITTGGGGMIVTDSETWARRAKYLTTQAKDDAIEFVHGEVGYNYRLTNVQAAIGCAQLENMGGFIQAKRDIAKRYEDGLTAVSGITTMPNAIWAQSVYWMYTILIDKYLYGISSRELLRVLSENKIETRPLWQPIHLSPAHKECHSVSYTMANMLNHIALSLPCSINLSAVDQDKIINCIKYSYSASY